MSNAVLYAALDLGGTNTRAVLFDVDFRRLVTVAAPTPPKAKDNPRGVCRTVLGCLRALRAAKEEVAREAELPGVGAALAGITRGGRVTEATRLPTDDVLADLDLLTYRDMIREGLKVGPETVIALENDACCATMFEVRHGVAEGYPLVYYVTISTGFGGGVAWQGELPPDPPPLADEPGRNILCKGVQLRHGFVSGQAIVDEYWRRGGLQAAHSARGVAELARQGDRAARAAFRRYARFLGYGIAVAMVGLVAHYGEVPRVVLGGGISQSMSLLANALCTAVVTTLGGGSKPLPDAVEGAVTSLAAYRQARGVPSNEAQIRRDFEAARERLRAVDIRPEFFVRSAMGEWTVAAGAAALARPR